MENAEKLMEENIQLKRALAIYMNKHLIKELFEALSRINSGEYISEEEFFRDFPLTTS